MKVVIQRVSKAEVRCQEQSPQSIGQGFLIYLGVGKTDTEETIDWLTQKILNLRAFSDDEGKMNLSIQDVQGSLLVISQFTLYGSLKKGNRPSFSEAGDPIASKKLYLKFLKTLQLKTSLPVKSGVFGADMKVESINDGPVTFVHET